MTLYFVNNFNDKILENKFSFNIINCISGHARILSNLLKWIFLPQFIPDHMIMIGHPIFCTHPAYRTLRRRFFILVLSCGCFAFLSAAFFNFIRAHFEPFKAKATQSCFGVIFEFSDTARSYNYIRCIDSNCLFL